MPNSSKHEEVDQKLAELDEQIDAQLKVIQGMLGRKTPFEKVQEKFNDVAKMFLEKQSLLEQILDNERGDLGPAEYEEQKKMIKETIQNRIVKIALIIDNAMSDEQKSASGSD